MSKNISISKFIIEKNKLKRLKKKIVMTNGCFDILHPGHIRILKESKKLGDILVVLVNSDISVKKNKGKNRPIQKQKDRIEVLCSIKFVDYVIMFNDKEPTKLYKKFLPEILTKGNEYNKNMIAGANEVIKGGGKIKLINMKKNFSTSRIIQKIIK